MSRETSMENAISARQFDSWQKTAVSMSGSGYVRARERQKVHTDSESRSRKLARVALRAQLPLCLITFRKTMLLSRSSTWWSRAQPTQPRAYIFKRFIIHTHTATLLFIVWLRATRLHCCHLGRARFVTTQTWSNKMRMPKLFFYPDFFWRTVEKAARKSQIVNRDTVNRKKRSVDFVAPGKNKWRRPKLNWERKRIRIAKLTGTEILIRKRRKRNWRGMLDRDCSAIVRSFYDRWNMIFWLVKIGIARSAI